MYRQTPTQLRLPRAAYIADRILMVGEVEAATPNEAIGEGAEGLKQDPSLSGATPSSLPVMGLPRSAPVNPKSNQLK
jgi:hypothetical protein